MRLSGLCIIHRTAWYASYFLFFWPLMASSLMFMFQRQWVTVWFLKDAKILSFTSKSNPADLLYFSEGGYSLKISPTLYLLIFPVTALSISVFLIFLCCFMRHRKSPVGQTPTRTKHLAGTCRGTPRFIPKTCYLSLLITPILRRASKFDLYPISGGELLMRFLWTFPPNFIRVLWMRSRRRGGWGGWVRLFESPYASKSKGEGLGWG